MPGDACGQPAAGPRPPRAAPARAGPVDVLIRRARNPGAGRSAM
jgi:hypothetical protein